MEGARRRGLWCPDPDVRFEWLRALSYAVQTDCAAGTQAWRKWLPEELLRALGHCRVARLLHAGLRLYRKLQVLHCRAPPGDLGDFLEHVRSVEFCVLLAKTARERGHKHTHKHAREQGQVQGQVQGKDWFAKAHGQVAAGTAAQQRRRRRLLPQVARNVAAQTRCRSRAHAPARDAVRGPPRQSQTANDTRQSQTAKDTRQSQRGKARQSQTAKDKGKAVAPPHKF
jgi:hypothetical protein